MVQFRGGFLFDVVVVVAALNLKAQVLWVDLGVSDPSLGSTFMFFACISPILATSCRKNTINVRGTIGSGWFL